ncbi:site-specific DNA-methyltransferase [Muricaecibacterium torontonense]|jgi:adenine-specific DNA-methyltransferase|uniref:Site-specific DNA-methyltransferase n=1 Tax=Muricaecibacterium torontonense TaxID=3032871 RepID=A0A4S2F3Q1_9ACTN|nr:site-specific DNA-methyltransferase [Muricaecibacterium torontonense]TGY62193.1 site-specific DNA-methyltransferase [Muricaecibacterium torontonense]
MAEFEKMDLTSANLVAERIEQLKQLLPEIATEGGIDFDKLRLVLGDEVDEGTERYAFTWPGKTDAVRQSQTPSTATLRPCPEESVDWDETENLCIEGDNLEVLKLLQHSYHGRIKCIFIDPPYNTGTDFIYPDSFGDTIEHYREQLNLGKQSNADTSGRFHANWCSLLYPRLRLARELLSEDGVILITIDHVEFANLKKLCDEIFGENCFAAHLAWRSSDSSNNNALSFSEDFNDVLVYCRTPGWRPNFLNDPEKRKHYKNPDNDPRGPYYDGGDVSNPGVRPNLQFDITTPSGNVIKHPANGWRWSRERMDEMFKTGELRFSPDETRVIKRRYLADMKGLPPSTLLIDLNKTGHTRAAKYELKALFPELPVADLFSTPKPTALMKYLLELVIDRDCIVMDFFAGSGATADAVMKFNTESQFRVSCISVQIPEPVGDGNDTFNSIFDMCRERIKRAGEQISARKSDNLQLPIDGASEREVDTGFRVLKLDESGIERPKPGELLLDVVKPDRSDEDIIFEMMLRWGLELTLPIEKVNAAGYPCYSVAYGELVCCLADGLNMQALDAIADMEPRRVLMLDRILDDTTKLNAVQAFKRVEEKTGREVELRTV